MINRDNHVHICEQKVIESGRVRGKGRFSDSDPVLAIFSRCFRPNEKTRIRSGSGRPQLPRILSVPGRFGVLSFRPPFVACWCPASPTPSPGTSL